MKTNLGRIFPCSTSRIIDLILVSIFFYLSAKSFFRLFKMDIMTTENTESAEDLLFPSVTVCKFGRYGDVKQSNLTKAYLEAK